MRNELRRHCCRIYYLTQWRQACLGTAVPSSLWIPSRQFNPSAWPEWVWMSFYSTYATLSDNWALDVRIDVWQPKCRKLLPYYHQHHWTAYCAKNRTDDEVIDIIVALGLGKSKLPFCDLCPNSHLTQCEKARPAMQAIEASSFTSRAEIATCRRKPSVLTSPHLGIYARGRWSQWQQLFAGNETRRYAQTVWQAVILRLRSGKRIQCSAFIKAWKEDW